jgi:hypothetical protein
MKKRIIKKETIFEAINSIYKQSEGKIPNQELYTILKKELLVLSNYTKLSEEESYVFAVIFYVNLMGESVNLNELCKYFKTNTFSLLRILDTIQLLVDKGIVKSKKNRPRLDNILYNFSYTIAKSISYNLLKGKEFPEAEAKKALTEIEIIESFNALGQQCIDSEIQAMDLEELVTNLLENYSFFETVKFVQIHKLTIEEIVVFFYVIWNTLCGQNGIDIENLCSSIFTSKSKQVLFTQSMAQEMNPLIKNGLLEYVSTGFMNNFETTPSKKTVDFLATVHVIIKMQTSRRASFIQPSSIREKTLYYSDNENKQIEAVSSILQEENYTQLIDRMRSKGLPQGINVLLFGAPGTGKTESVLQLAKQSGREIVRVDISNTKSMWFGESEKIIKRIFNEYREYAKRSTLAPILFFNEADAVLSKRISHSSSNTQQTENAIQNIILDELENFEGIFMATTNLMHNLDKAFERRFLYKVEFIVPSNLQRSSIWQSKFPALSSETCADLAENYKLSGGQIDNIYRKSEINFILHNKEVTHDLLIRFCEEEVNHTQNQVQIGFVKAT